MITLGLTYTTMSTWQGSEIPPSQHYGFTPNVHILQEPTPNVSLPSLSLSPLPSNSLHYYTLYNPILELRLYFPFILFSFALLIYFRTPYCLTLTAYPHPLCSYLYSPFPLTVNSITPSQTYSFPPCCAHFPAPFSVVIKASYQCKVEPVRISTKFNPLAH